MTVYSSHFLRRSVALPGVPLFLGLLLFLVPGSGQTAAQEAGTAPATGPDTAWVDCMLSVRSALGSAPKESSFAPVVSSVVPYGNAAVPIKVDITGLTHVWLVVGDGGNGTGHDHAAWLDPALVRANGDRVLLSTLSPFAVTLGWNTFRVNVNVRNRPLTVAGTRYETGLWCHARSVVGYRLEEGEFERLEALGGIDDSAGEQGRVTFEVHATIPWEAASKASWSRIVTLFPESSEAFLAELHGNTGETWLASPESPELEATAIRRMAEELGASAQGITTRLTALEEGHIPASDRRWLELFVVTRDAVVLQREATDAMAFAERTLVYVEQVTPRASLRRRLIEWQKKIEMAKRLTDPGWSALRDDVLALRREIILSHPALDFESLLINKRPPPTYSHQCDQYLGRHSRPGPGPVVLTAWKERPKERVLLAGLLPTGTVTHPDLSFDAKHIAFSYCAHDTKEKNWRRFLLYEIGTDGSGLRRLTGTGRDPMQGREGRQTVLIEDFDPCYLPDGGIAFISTRCQTFGRCHGRRYNPSYMLYRCDGDGSNIRQLSFGEANEWDPSVLADGRLIYTRWDYINRHDTLFQSLWTMHPDGTGTAHFYGNYTRNPCMTAEARAVPGSGRIVCTAMAHHAYTAGSVILVDPHRGQDGPEPIARLTPEVKFPETEGWDMQGVYATPWPLNEDLYLVAYTPNRLAHQGRYQETNAFGIYLIDSMGGRELIYRDPDMSCFAPIPLVSRPPPPALPSTLPGAPAGTPGFLYVQDVQRGRHPLPEVRIAAIRVNRIYGQPTCSVPHRGVVRQELPKRIIGTVPVDAHGHAASRAPSGVPLQLQALDKDGMAVMTMRSFVYLQPGEKLSCIGCHEHRSTAPILARYPSVARGVGDPIPPAGPRYDGGFSFMRTVQPVLDRYCIGCHGLKQPSAGELSLVGTPVDHPITEYPGWPRTVRVTESYANLLVRPDLVRIAQRNRESTTSRPDDYFARAGRLARYLLRGHCAALLKDRASLRCVLDWLDLNAQFYGDYSWNRVEHRQADPDGEKALRAYIAGHVGAELAQQPLAALVNVAQPDDSRILRAVLPLSAGGWAEPDKAVWAVAEAPQFGELRRLVGKAVQPLASQDVNGTCGHGKCTCGTCWVRQARDAWLARDQQ